MIQKFLNGILKHSHKSEINQIHEENRKRLTRLNTNLIKHGFQAVSMETMRVIATKRMFECYNDEEICNILHHFNLLSKEVNDNEFSTKN